MGAASALQLIAGLCVLTLAAAAMARERRDWHRRSLPSAPRRFPPPAWRALQRATLPAALTGTAAALLLIIDAFLADGVARPLRLVLGAALLTGLVLVASTMLAGWPRPLVPPALRWRRGS